MNLSTNPFFTHGINKLCTICHVILKDADSTHSIYSTLEEMCPMNVMQALQSFSNFNFYNGPEMVCTTCYRKTIEVYKFIQMCNRAHENIQNYLKHEDIRTRNDSNYEEIDEMKVDIKIEEIDISPTRITIDEQKVVEEMEKQRTSIIEEMMFSSADIKIEERTLHVHSSDSDNEVKVKLHKCERCDRRFSRAANLRSHMDIHNDVKAHKCEQCDRPFTRAADLRRHMNIHNGIKPYKCEQCGRRFTHAANLRSHMDMHNGVKAHKCEQCDRRFTHLANLGRHIDSHNGVRAHKCEQCNRRFIRAADLRRHMHIHTAVKANNAIGDSPRQRACAST